MAYGDVEAVPPLPFLIDDRVHADGRFARAAVADDELALAASDGDHRVDGLEACLERLLDRAPVDDARRITLERPELRRRNWALAVDGLPEGVDDTPGQGLARRHLGDALGARD